MSYLRGVGRGLNVKNVKIYGRGSRGGAGAARSGAEQAGLGPGAPRGRQTERQMTNDSELGWQV